MALDSETATLKLEVDSSQAMGAISSFRTKMMELSESVNQQADQFNKLTQGLKQTFDVLTSGVRAYAELASQGDRVGDIMGALTVDVRQASGAVGGMISTTNLAIVANRAHQAGLDLTDKQFRAVIVAAKQYADATGGDATQAAEQLTGAIIRGSSRGLKPFGIDARDTAGAIEELTRKFGDASVAAVGLGDNLDVAKGGWDNLTDAVARSINDESGGVGALVGLFGRTATAISESEVATRGLGTAMTNLLSPLLGIIGAVQDVLTSFTNLNREMARMGFTSGQHLAESAAASGLEGEAPDRPRRGVATTAAGSGLDFSRAPAATGGTTRRRRGGGGGGRRREEGGEDILPDLVAEMTALSNARIEAAKNANEQIDESNRAMYDRQRTQEQAALEAFAANEQSAIDIKARETEAYIAGEQAKNQAVQSTTQSVLLQTGAMIAQGASAGDIFRTVLSNALSAIAGEAAARAAFYLALGLGLQAATMGFPNPGSVQAFAAAAGFGALAIGLGAAAGFIAPSTSSGNGGASGKVAGSERLLPGATRGGGGESIVNVTVYLDAAGGVVQDAQLRRLSTYVREAGRRGYLKGIA